jgi:hypothetical protein
MKSTDRIQKRGHEMKSRIENGNLIIELPIEKPRPSASGRTIVVATTRGVKLTSVLLKGRKISINANAFIYPNKSHGPVADKSAKPRRGKKERKGNEGEQDEY